MLIIKQDNTVELRQLKHLGWHKGWLISEVANITKIKNRHPGWGPRLKQVCLESVPDGKKSESKQSPTEEHFVQTFVH